MKNGKSIAVARARVSRVDIQAVAAAALHVLPDLCARWLPSGKREGREWVCGSLRGEPGRSCKVNLATGRWCDFATGERGGDVVSLAAAISGLSQPEAARRLAAILELEGGRT
jgi:putative DNA primase/helicase